MRYVGGKSRLAPDIAQVIQNVRGQRRRYLEPFVGGGAVFARVAPGFGCAIAADIVLDVALLWAAIGRGWLPPTTLSYRAYGQLRMSRPSALRAFAGFGCSFGGKWFGGYARGGFNSDGTPRDHQAESSRCVAKMAPAFTNARIACADYRAFMPGADTVVYCDPPYAVTTPYGAAGHFNSDEFWCYAQKWSDAGAAVVISEYSAPPGWVAVLTRPHRQSLQHGRGGRPVTVEHVWVRG